MNILVLVIRTRILEKDNEIWVSLLQLQGRQVFEEKDF